MSHNIKIRLVDTILHISPVSYLGNRFGDYLKVCREIGCGYNPTVKAQTCSVAQLPLLTHTFAANGFTIFADRHVATAARREAEQQRQRETAAAKQIEGRGLYPFQAQGVAALVANDRYLLADDMGLGKTVQALVALPENAAAIIVCPAVVKRNWANECVRWRPDLKPVVLKSLKSFRFPFEGEVVIINYELLPQILPAVKWYNNVPFVLIADEAHYLKNNKAQRTQKFRALAKVASKVWLLTGTPLLNKPPELWGVLQAASLAKLAYGTWAHFVDLFGGYRGQFGYEWAGTPKPGAENGLARVSLRRRKHDVLPDLPAKTYRYIDVELDREQKKECDEVMELADFNTTLFGESADEPEWMGGIDGMSECRKNLAMSKLNALVALVMEYEEQQEPVVVFSAHRAPIDAIGQRDGWEAITGDTTHENRAEIVARFQAGELRGVACTIQAGGVGITLTRASHAIFVDQMWTPALNQQAEDRICRIGQDRGCVYTILRGDHDLEHMVCQALEFKQKIINASVEKMSTPSNAITEADKLDRVADEIEFALTLAEKADITPSPVRVRGPQTPQEEWARQALICLSGRDGDRARDKNGIGFSSHDTDFGNSLAEQLQSRGGLTDKQWTSAVKILQKYHRQVGVCPAAEKSA